jgi:hypothetical protein
MSLIFSLGICKILPYFQKNWFFTGYLINRYLLNRLARQFSANNGHIWKASLRIFAAVLFRMKRSRVRIQALVEMMAIG